MNIFSKLFGGQPAQPDAADKVRKLIDRFTTATIMGIDREDLGRYPHKQHKVMAFHYGAIEYLGRQHDLSEDRILGLFVAFIDRYFNMPVSETGSITDRLQGFHDNPDEQCYLDAGVAIFRRWHEDNDRRAPLELGEMLKQP